MKRAVLYLRVSTLDQTTANQERELREIAGRMGCEIVHVYKDHGVSGAKGHDKRPQFDHLCRDAAKRQFDVVMAWSVDRLGRSLQDLVAFLSEIHALGIDLFLHQQGLDTTTPAGKAMFQMMGVFAEFERAMIQERVRAGLARARSEGKKLGRPIHIPRPRGTHQAGPCGWIVREEGSSSVRCSSRHSSEPRLFRGRRRWRVMLIRKRAQVLGYVDAPSREVAEAAAASAFSLTMSSASGSWCRSGTERASASQL